MAVLLPLVILAILVLGGVYIVFLRRAGPEGAGRRTVALIGLGLGIVAAALTALVAVLSTTTFLDAMPWRDPLAMVAFLGLPVALVGVGCGVLGLKSEARGSSVVGLVLSAVSILAWIVMQITLGG